MTLADGTRLHAGDLAFNDPDVHGRYESEFEYTENWLAHPEACDLDPESLRLARKLAVADKSVGEIGVVRPRSGEQDFCTWKTKANGCS